MSNFNRRGSQRGGRQAGPQLPKALLTEVDPGASNRNRGRPRGTFSHPPHPRRAEVSASLKEFNARPMAQTTKVRISRPDVQHQEPPRKKKKPEMVLPGPTSADAEDGEIEWLEYMLRKEKAKDDAMSDGLDDLLDFADLVGPGGQGLQPGAEEDGIEVSSEESEDGSVEDSPGTAPDAIPATNDKATTMIPVHVGEEQIGNRYIPPQLRAAQLEAKARGDKAREAERLKLERRLQGVLNKLSEANMETMLAEIENLYKDHSRNDVSTIITDLTIGTIANRSNLLDSFVVLYATLVGSLHRILGLEFGAHFIHATITRYRSATSILPATIYETPDASKSPLNLLTLIAELYNAQVVGANLIYDFIRSFIDDAMGEIQVESLLRLLRCSGQQLRSDDPASLKDIVHLVQEATKGKEITTRTKFMVETLVDLKGGKKLTQTPDKMRSFLAGLGRKRRIATAEPLRVSLQDFIDADTKGKWWLVGAGWAGNPLVEREKTTGNVEMKSAEEDEEVLLEAARSQGMNTDIRRSVFVILMTSEDYIHACDRLSLLKFAETQQREFIRVALHCCATEKVYNPYHTLIINHLCSESYSHRFTLQYALWDFLRDLGNDSRTRIRCSNVAQTAAYTVARGSLDLTVFKAVDFTTLKPCGAYFFSVFLSRLLLATQTASPLFALSKTTIDSDAVEAVFEKALVNLDLAQGLAWVLRQGVRKGLEGAQATVVARAAKMAAEVLARAV